ncbi:AGE family epimerase/isomerase [Motilibacter aurantiacus]|uniref:AGE family epimerase/isomerase n=1 Tax=Motilibacter aurantiacus TaxID=2714955 RepID=UPI00140B4510|nr:AGE family epimerase/isomerase [Motilibacter aurantiacus]NHC44841.1 AGE family epimerase/isomerase [Motilibacter aurantiacus]
MTWTALPSHLAWLDEEGRRLLAFAEASRHPAGGFAWLDNAGKPELHRPVETWITARMTHVFALAHLRGLPGAGDCADAGVAALCGLLRDAEHGGWHSAVWPDGRPAGTAKEAYVHSFVVLAAASAAAAGRAGAQQLLSEALEVMGRSFWDEQAGRCVEAWDASWEQLDAYRGANSNMHAVECFLAAADVTGEGVWRRRALSIAGHLVHGAARAHRWRLPEHFDADWQPVLDYNVDSPADQFRPYGSTVGHWLEWSRLLLNLEAALQRAGEPVPGWLLEDAVALFDAAVEVGWQPGGAPGFVYTVDWDDRPVVRARMHWVLAEAIGAAATLLARTGQARYEQWYRTWWDTAACSFLDREHGSWHHELDSDNLPAATVWDGKPDVYHAYQATLLPQLPAAPTLAVALRDLAGTTG